ncbi:MAG: NAD(P)/FAD-dependent oxidoreductase [Chloroflexota bacterium]|nr:NAD(P)/FAD-dependent oxidoreductase [Chloroflexota bacterium]
MSKNIKTPGIANQENNRTLPADIVSTQKQPTDTKPRVVIVGAGFGGLRAARGLRNTPIDVIVIDRNNHHLFQPLLYQVATAGLSPADICAPIRSILKRQANTSVILGEVTGVDLPEQRVLMHDKAMPYDYLILATGARHSYFGHDDWEPFAPGLKSITDATMLRRNILLAFEAAEIETDPDKLRSLLTFVLVGAGPTGVEMAGAIAELAHKALTSDFRHIDPASARIILVEAGPRILATFPERLASRAQKELNHLGVEVRTGAAAEGIDADGVVIAGKHLAAQTVIWTAGVAASLAGQWLGAETDRAGRVKILPDLTIPSHPNVFVIGDTASLAQNGKPLPGLAQVAMQEGTYAASLITRRLQDAHTSTAHAVAPFHYRDKGNLATVGRSFGIVDIKHIQFTGFIAWVIWLAVHIFFLIGYRNRLLVMFQWAWAYFTFQRGARLITYSDKTSLIQ